MQRELAQCPARNRSRPIGNKVRTPAFTLSDDGAGGKDANGILDASLNGATLFIS
jgi:hypothetical protein